MQELNENSLELVSGGYAIPTPVRLERVDLYCTKFVLDISALIAKQS